MLVAVLLGVAAQLDLHRPLRPHDLPGIAEAQPVVGALLLPAIDDLLVEDAELVADAVAHRGNLERRQRIDEAGSEPPEAAIAQARLLLELQQLVEIQPEFADGVRTSSYMPRLMRLLPRCGPIRNSADR